VSTNLISQFVCKHFRAQQNLIMRISTSLSLWIGFVMISLDGSISQTVTYVKVLNYYYE